MNIEDRLQKSNWQEPLYGITMPDSVKENYHRCQKQKSKDFHLKYVALPIAALALVVTMLSGTTAYAAYQVHQHKTLRVFFENSVTQEQIDTIGEQINQIEGIYVSRYVTSDTAWTEYSSAYLDEDLVMALGDNPLVDSSNYEVSVLLTGDTRTVIDQISAIDGVRLVSTLAELEK